MCGGKFDGREKFCSRECKFMKRREANRIANILWRKKGMSEVKVKEPRVSHIDDIERYARNKGQRYADIQKAETIRLYGRVEI